MMGKKKYLLMFIVLMFLSSLATVNVPVQASPSPVTFYVDMPPGGYIPGQPSGEIVVVDILVNASELPVNSNISMVGWGIDVQVNPDVLEPLGASGATTGYFLYDFMKAYYPFGYSISLLIGSINTTTGYMDEVSAQILPTPTTGAGGTGTLVTLGFQSKSETAYSPIDISIYQYDPGEGKDMWQAVWMNTTKGWFDVAAVDGHYNPPPKGSLSGKVIDNATKGAIADATLSYVSGPTPFGDTITEADGNYTITDLNLGNYSITASKVGYGNQTKNITIIEGPNTLNFELTSIAMPPGWIEGFVINNTTKTVIVGATVMANGAYNITNDIGYYKIDNLPPTTYTVAAGAVGFPPQSQTVTVTSEAGTTLNFTLESVSPYIAVVPHGTMNSSLAPGMNFTISIHTNYTGDDVWGYVFSLTYNPLVLQGVEVTNGDLITKEDGETMWIPGTFDNEVGKLTPAFNGFKFGKDEPAPLTSGPGTLATVTFQVVGIGTSDITLVTEVTPSGLYGYTEGINPETNMTEPGWGEQFLIIDGETEPDRIQHGFFTNVQSIHDVAIINIEAPTTAVAGGDYVPINVTVVNEGIYLEVVNLTVTIHNDTTEIRTESFLFNLASGLFRVNSFSWDTAGLTSGTYTINATATTFNPDEDPDDNTKTKQIEIITIHDVAVINIEAQDEATVKEIVPINVTVANKGSFYENVNVTVSYDDTLIDITLIDMLSPGESEIVEFSWNTTGLMPGTYTINATATIASDANITNNSNAKRIELKWSYDVAVRSIGVSPYTTVVGEPVTIDVYVENLGVYNATFEVGVTYDTSIETKTVTLAAGASTTISFTWNTTDVAPDSYTITAEAFLLTDEDLTNNLKSRSIVLNLPLGAIVGTVTDALTGDPIQGATINANGYSASTDADGHYNITDMPLGTYTITSSKTGYESASQNNILVVAGENTTVDFTLRVNSIITISADPVNITVGVSTTISGSIEPARKGVAVTIWYRLSGEEAWANLTTVTTNEQSQYSDVWTPETAGTYEVKASWLGDESVSSAESDVQSITVQETPAPGVPLYIYMAAAGVAAIILAAMAFYFLKVKKPKPT